MPVEKITLYMSIFLSRLNGTIISRTVYANRWTTLFCIVTVTLQRDVNECSDNEFCSRHEFSYSFQREREWFSLTPVEGCLWAVVVIQMTVSIFTVISFWRVSTKKQSTPTQLEFILHWLKRADCKQPAVCLRNRCLTASLSCVRLLSTSCSSRASLELKAKRQSHLSLSFYCGGFSASSTVTSCLFIANNKSAQNHGSESA